MCVSHSRCSAASFPTADMNVALPRLQWPHGRGCAPYWCKAWRKTWRLPPARKRAPRPLCPRPSSALCRPPRTSAAPVSDIRHACTDDDEVLRLHICPACDGCLGREISLACMSTASRISACLTRRAWHAWRANLQSLKALQRSTCISCAGRQGMLARRAARLFTHIKDALQKAKLGSPFGADYSAVLRTHLLTVPAYCAAVPAATFQRGWPQPALGQTSHAPLLPARCCQTL